MARSKNVIGLDIGTSSVKLVHLNETKKGIHLLDCAAEALPRDAIVDGQLMNATAVVETVRHLVEKRKLKTKDVAVSISGRSVIIKKISLPDMDRNALDDTIKWEAEQHIPFDINDVYLAYEILQRRPEQGQMDVLLVAAKQEVVGGIALGPRLVGVVWSVLMVLMAAELGETCLACAAWLVACMAWVVACSPWLMVMALRYWLGTVIVLARLRYME